MQDGKESRTISNPVNEVHLLGLTCKMRRDPTTIMDSLLYEHIIYGSKIFHKIKIVENRFERTKQLRLYSVFQPSYSL